MVKHLHLKGLAMALACAMSMGAYAATPITDAAGLSAIGENPDGDYELAADITLDGEWLPIGNDAAPFTGTFDGKGHTIKGLTITDNSNFVGLFGVVTGTVKNLSIVDADIYGNEHVGIVAGRVRGGGVIDNVFTSGYICGRDHTGGIVGDAGESEQGGVVKNCLSAAYVISRDYQAGGIVGWSKGTVTIENNIFIGEASCHGYGATAGIVGFIEDGTTTVKHNVNAARQLIGMFGGRNTYGIAGNTYNENSNLVSVDNLTSDACKIINIYYDPNYVKGEDDEPYYLPSVQYLDQANAPVDFNGTVTPAADLLKAATYTALDFGSTWNLNSGYYPLPADVKLPLVADLIHTATAPEEIFVANTFNLDPVSTFGRDVKIAVSDNTVATLDKTTLTFVKVGTVTVTLTTEGNNICAGATKTFTFEVQDFDPTIATAADIDKMRENPSGNFVLTADIDMSGVDFTPIGNFSGNLDGQGHWIRNLSYNSPNTPYVAFISNFSGEYIKNIGFENVNFVGNENIAAVVGVTNSPCVISNVVVASSYIEGRDHVGSILGNISGGATLVNCIANAVVYTRQYQCGGLVGIGVNGTVDKCIFTGTVAAAGTTNLASIIPLFDDNNVTIKNCLAGAITYTGNQNYNANVCNLYSRPIVLENNWVTEYSIKNGVAVAGGETDSENGGLATQADVRSKEWYENTLGFDFDNDWAFLPGSEGKMLPVLKWMKAPVTTQIFGLPSEDGANLTYIEGTEFFSCSSMLGSWGQNITVTQVSGEDYASVLEEDGETRIYVGNEDGELPKGSGTAVFKVGFGALDDLFTVSGRDTFDVNVSMFGSETVISTVEDFLNIRKNPSGKYTLGADIDFAGAQIDGFCNDGNSAFTGTIDGAGYSVKNFVIKFTGGNDKGLFGKTSNATFKNIAFTQFTIDGGLSGANHVGIIGGGSAYFENVAIVGDVIGNDHVGLVAGDADGIEMLNCYAVGTVQAGSQLGGYFGCTLTGGCTIEKCLSNVNVIGSFRGWAGGFIGLIDKSESTVTIKDCVSIGNCTVNGTGTPKHTGPFIAGNGGGSDPNAIVFFSGNIYNSNATMESENGADWPANHETVEGGNVEPATAQNPNTLAVQSTYEAIGWDFKNVWKMGEGDYKYPVLGTVKVTDFSGVEDVVADAEANVTIAAANGEIIVSGLGESSVIAVYTAAGVQVANVSVTSGDAVVAVPAHGFYIVAVATDGASVTSKVVVK